MFNALKSYPDPTDSSSGFLTVHTDEGNIDAYVSQTGTAELHTKQGILKHEYLLKNPAFCLTVIMTFWPHFNSSLNAL